MQNDIVLVVGLVIGVLAVPAIFSAISDGNPPRVAAFAVVVSGAMIIYAVFNQPGGYTVSELPTVFTRVVASFLK